MFRKRASLLSALLCLLPLNTHLETLSAQPPGGAPPFPFPGGPFPGGPGMGMPGFGPPGMPGIGAPGMFGDPGSPLVLIELREVREELNVDSELEGKLTSIQDSRREGIREVMETVDFSAAFELSKEERAERFSKMQADLKEVDDRLEATLMEQLSEPQRVRLKQLARQRAGLQAWKDEELLAKASLTPAQREKLDEMLQSPPFGGRRGGFGGFPGGPFGGPFGGPPADLLGPLIDSLNAEQKQIWEEWIGAKFTFPQPTFMGGPPMGQSRKILAQFDADSNGRLDKEERAAAREFLKSSQSSPGGMAGRSGREGGPRFGGPDGPRPPRPEGMGRDGFGPGGPRGGRGPGGPGGPGGGPGGMGPGRGSFEPAKPGLSVKPSEVENYSDRPLYDKSIVRTLFLEFEESDWEQQLSDFSSTDVDVEATLQVDGKTYPGVGVRYRGMSSLRMVPQGNKKSLNLSIDFADGQQRLYGRKTLNLLNSNEDPSFMRAVLYTEIAQKYTKAPVANFVQVVVNGENWGLYVNVEQFNKEFVEERFGSSKGMRWKVEGRPGGRGGLEYVGDDPASYKSLFTIKSKDTDASWKALIDLCKTLNETPSEELPEKIEPILAVDEVLGFLAMDVVFVNGDGYWTRASDYSLLRDANGVFHVIPHDINETFSTGGGGPGFGPQAGGGGSGVELDPLVGIDDPSKPLRSKLLAVPKYRKRYLEIVASINNEILGGEFLQSRIDAYAPMIRKVVEQDTKKLYSLSDFESSLTLSKEEGAGRRRVSLPDFASKRHAFLSDYLKTKE